MKPQTIQDLWPYLTDEARKGYLAQGIKAPVAPQVSTQPNIEKPSLDTILRCTKPEHQATVRARFREINIGLRLTEAYSAIRLYGQDSYRDGFKSTNLPKDATPETAAAYDLADRLLAVGHHDFTFEQALDFATKKLAEERTAKINQYLAQHSKQ